MTPGMLFDLGIVGDAPAPSIPKGHGRYLFKCSGNSVQSYPYAGNVSVPCAPVWLTLPEERRRLSRGYGRYDYETRPLPDAEPRRCTCGAWIRRIHRLEVSDSAQKEPTHTCENTCQWSESKKCRCACGGRRHGEALREWRWRF